VRLLNRGGFANPDVLVVPGARRPPFVVKDWSQRSLLVRWLLAPRLAAHELAMLECGCGLPGLPRPAGRIDRLAFAMEFMPGQALRRRHFRGSLPLAFFVALEGIFEGLAGRGLLYTDLRSPTNILVTPSGAPALVDLGSAFALPVPRAFRSWLQRRAFHKLRARFEGERVLTPGLAPDHDDVDLGRERLALLDRGRGEDPVPVLLLADLGLAGSVFRGVLARAEACGRRALAVDLAGFGRSRRTRRAPSVANAVRDLVVLLDALRLARVDVVGHGFGDRVARELAARRPDRVRSGVTLAQSRETQRARLAAPAEELRRRLLEDLPRALTASERSEVEGLLAEVEDRRLLRACRELGAPLTSPPQPWSAVEDDVFAEPQKLFARLAQP
jgi:pimeloyl-ACP methyl ester carboxylesterase